MTDDTSAPEPSSAEAPVAPHAASAAAWPAPRPRPRWRQWQWWRRVLRGKPGAVLAAAVAGVLLGAGTMAWQTGAPPFFDEDACWGTLSEDDLEALPLGSEKIRAQELSPGDGVEVSGECRLTGDRYGRADWAVTFRVHTPGGDYGSEPNDWHEKFLASDMAPLGGELLGMTSPARAWLTLPQSCASGSSAGSDPPPTIVDVDTGGSGRYSGPEDDEMRRVLGRAVTRVANGTMDRLGCDGRFEDPGELPALTQAQDSRPEALCGIEGLNTPSSADEQLVLERRSGGGGPIRSCDLGYSDYDIDDVHLITVEHPGLARSLTHAVRGSGTRIESDDGDGTLGSARAAFEASCQTGPVVFMLSQGSVQLKPATARALFSEYVAAEAKRIGCGPLKMEIPAIG
ncbi:hypothetical protein LHJ74_09730 [Streptomyces sp. N2-109]|uniref:Uncharacterized protein n=1 Tax=Streptomyces gossypii TaxID=2883101 RepID=A0ABT2JQM0_9ACTN|nr:hypothetical protein [Streptomyces gossypii]MCT2590188.1 hypothetical protein [Streptomyces gossypii]